LIASRRVCDATDLPLKDCAYSKSPDLAPTSRDILTQLELREAERDHAFLRIREALYAIETRGNVPDRWESAFLLYAIDMTTRGQYAYALNFVEQAMTAAAERTRLYRPSDKCFDRVGMSALKHALEDVQSLPILRDPDFRPSPLCLQPDLLESTESSRAAVKPARGTAPAASGCDVRWTEVRFG
jgi:hypothetical protein